MFTAFQAAACFDSRNWAMQPEKGYGGVLMAMFRQKSSLKTEMLRFQAAFYCVATRFTRAPANQICLLPSQIEYR